MRQSVSRGAAWGCSAWLVYGIVELVLSCGTQLLRYPEMEILGWQWRLIGWLFATYAVAGLVLGGAGGLLLAAIRRDHIKGRHQTFAALTIAIAFAANLIPAWPLSGYEDMALAVAAILIGVFLAGLVSETWRHRTQFLASPWTVSLLLLTAPWMGREVLSNTSSGFVRTLFSLLSLCVVAGAAALFKRPPRDAPVPARREWGIAGAVLVAFFLLAFLWSGRTSPGLATQIGPQPPPGKPNILLITMDTVRADHMSLYRYQRDTTPHLRDFARVATVFTRAVATSDWTLPTHASLFTGLYPDWHGAHASLPEYPYGRPLPPDHTTLAEVLRSHGYWTGESVANHGLLAPWTGLTRGFMVSEWNMPVVLSPLVQIGELRRFYLRQRAARMLKLMSITSSFDRPFRTASDINERAMGMLHQAKQGGRPFFLFLNYMDAHWPYVPDQPFDTRFPGKDTHFDWQHLGDPVNMNVKEHALSAAEKAHLISQYDGGIASEDTAIESLLSQLRDLGLYTNTLIIITADHGEAFGEHNLLVHGSGAVYQELVHVPLIIKFPGQRDARHADGWVSQVDLMPTILDLAGITPSTSLPGRDLRQPFESGIVYSQASTPSNFPLARTHGVRAAFSGSMELITSTAGSTELYDLASDPTEEHDLYRTDDPRAIELKDRLDAWISTIPKSPLKHPAKPESQAIERLRSLGYAQ